MVNGSGSWQETWSRDKSKFENPGFHQAKNIVSMRLHMFELGMVSFRLLGPALVLSVRLLSDICGPLLGWNSVSMPLPAQRLQSLDTLDDTARAHFSARC